MNDIGEAYLSESLKSNEYMEQHYQKTEAVADRSEWTEKNSTRIAHAVARDSRVMSGIAAVTIVFLPATFLAVCFLQNPNM